MMTPPPPPPAAPEYGWKAIVFVFIQGSEGKSGLVMVN